MPSPKQLPLFPNSREKISAEKSPDLFANRDLGTFKDSMRAPIFRWFRYPAGYSYKFVYECFDLFNVQTDDWVYDPFSGTGTTLVCAKQNGINAYAIEAHSFVHWVASVKLYWEYDIGTLEIFLEKFLRAVQTEINNRVGQVNLDNEFPELIYKCYHPQDLQALYIIRESILQNVDDKHTADLLKLALTDALRGAAIAGTGWPYISPPKDKTNHPPKGAFDVFKKIVWQMLSDIRTLPHPLPQSEIHNVLGDSRNKQELEDQKVKLAITSPPYLNNYDYADRTRLETYFWGITESWKDITKQFRDKLMVAATTQITRSLYNPETALTQELHDVAPNAYRKIQNAVMELSEIRLQKGGKKDYDLMVALYFNDMLPILQESYRVLAPKGAFCLVLGDSAPYGVHIKTELLIGEIALGLGFSQYQYHRLRQRGGKWKKNPQRHTVPLQEGIVILTK